MRWRLRGFDLWKTFPKRSGADFLLPQHLDLINSLHVGENQSHRSKMNAVYASIAASSLGLIDKNSKAWHSDKYPWLCDFYKRRTILAELGRIHPDEDMHTAAAYLCKEKPSAAQAVKIIRSWRTGNTPPTLEAEIRANIKRWHR